METEIDTQCVAAFTRLTLKIWWTTMVCSFHLWSRKEQGFLQARQSSREMKRAAWQHKGQDCEVQSNLTHMECFRRGQKGDLLKDKIKLEKGERRSKGRMVPVKSGILGDSEYLQNQRHRAKQTRETEQQREERSVTKIFMWATHNSAFLILLMHQVYYYVYIREALVFNNDSI